MSGPRISAAPAGPAAAAARRRRRGRHRRRRSCRRRRTGRRRAAEAAGRRRRSDAAAWPPKLPPPKLPPPPNGLPPPPNGLPNPALPAHAARPASPASRPWMASITSWTMRGSMPFVGTSWTTLVESLACSSMTCDDLLDVLRPSRSVAVPTMLLVRSSAAIVRLHLLRAGRGHRAAAAGRRRTPPPERARRSPNAAPVVPPWLAAGLVLSRYTCVEDVHDLGSDRVLQRPDEERLDRPPSSRPARRRSPSSSMFLMVIRSRALARTRSELLDCSATIADARLVRHRRRVRRPPAERRRTGCRRRRPGTGTPANGFWFRFCCGCGGPLNHSFRTRAASTAFAFCRRKTW